MVLSTEGGGVCTATLQYLGETVNLDDLLPRTTDSPEATMALGEELAGALDSGDVVALYGNLGAGKTHLVKGIARGLGADPNEVTSPTFTLIQEYPTVPQLFHIDLYRIEAASELAALGLDEYLFGDGLCVIEWPERLGDRMPASAVRLELEHLSESRRKVSRR